MAGQFYGVLCFSVSDVPVMFDCGAGWPAGGPGRTRWGTGCRRPRTISYLSTGSLFAVLHYFEPSTCCIYFVLYIVLRSLGQKQLDTVKARFYSHEEFMLELRQHQSEVGEVGVAAQKLQI